MRLAILSDIHGNLTALDAVLADMRSTSDGQPEGIVCLGDVAQEGPQPHETIARLRALGCPVVMGNTDDKLIARAERLAQPNADAHALADSSGKLGEGAPSAEKQRSREVNQWTARQMSPDDLAYLRTFSPTLHVSLGGAEGGRALLCCHGSPRSYNDRTEATTSAEKLSEWLAEVDVEQVAVVASGHTHLQMLRRYRSLTLLNPGSVGLPILEKTAGEFRLLPCAEYAILTYAEGKRGIHIELRRTPFDVDAVIAAYLASDIPHAEWMVSDWQAITGG